MEPPTSWFEADCSYKYATSIWTNKVLYIIYISTEPWLAFMFRGLNLVKGAERSESLKQFPTFCQKHL